MILVADDDPDIRDMLSDALTDAGYQVALAQDGRNAQRVALEAPPDLILMDIMMPRQDGISTSLRLRHNPTTRAVPIILISASDRLCDTAHFAPVDDVIGKPFDLAEMLALVDQYCG